jgi:hypothetical protein
VVHPQPLPPLALTASGERASEKESGWLPITGMGPMLHERRPHVPRGIAAGPLRDANPKRRHPLARDLHVPEGLS